MPFLKGLLDRLRRSPETTPVSTPQPTLELTSLDEIAARISARVAEGYSTHDEIVATMRETLDGEIGIGDADLAAMVHAEILRHAEIEATWTGPTNCDLLTAAFAHLDREGIVARENLTRGPAGIRDEMDEAKEAGRLVDGFVFFHSHDLERAVEGKGLDMSFGAYDPDGGPETAIAIGRRVVAGLAAVGLQSMWRGGAAERIHVPFDWRRRRRPLDEEAVAS